MAVFKRIGHSGTLRQCNSRSKRARPISRSIGRKRSLGSPAACRKSYFSGLHIKDARAPRSRGKEREDPPGPQNRNNQRPRINHPHHHSPVEKVEPRMYLTNKQVVDQYDSVWDMLHTLLDKKQLICEETACAHGKSPFRIPLGSQEGVKKAISNTSIYLQ